jgi:uncharacterized protein (TIGR04255 family)
MASPHDLIVDFENPPVAEVGLSVQLRGATLDTSRAISAFFPTVQQHYPTIVPQPPVLPIEESFEIPTQATIAFQLLGGPESQRWAFVSEDELETLQVQSNRFTYAWAKEETDARYPHYGAIRDSFEGAYRSYLAAAEGDVEATWCEIFYANPIMQPEGEPRPDLSTLVRRVVPQVLPGLPQPFNGWTGGTLPAGARWHAIRPLLRPGPIHGRATPPGRLHDCPHDARPTRVPGPRRRPGILR